MFELKIPRHEESRNASTLNDLYLRKVLTFKKTDNIFGLDD